MPGLLEGYKSMLSSRSIQVFRREKNEDRDVDRKTVHYFALFHMLIEVLTAISGLGTGFGFGGYQEAGGSC